MCGIKGSENSSMKIRIAYTTMLYQSVRIYQISTYQEQHLRRPLLTIKETKKAYNMKKQKIFEKTDILYMNPW